MTYHASLHFPPYVPARPAGDEEKPGGVMRVVTSSGETLYIVGSSEFQPLSAASSVVSQDLTFQNAPSLGHVESEIAGYETGHDAMGVRGAPRTLVDLRSLDGIVKTLVERNMALAFEARGNAAAPFQPSSPFQASQATHAAGYDAAVAAGADVRARLFKEMASSDDFASHAGVSRETVNTQRKAGRLLALTNGTRSFRYPLWQLEPTVKSAMEAVLRELRPLDPWTIHLFLTQRNPLLAGQSPLECLRSARVDDVLDAARSYADDLA